MNRWWERKGIYLLLPLILFGVIWYTPLAGIGFMCMVTVPCGVKQVNRNRWLWTIRQTYFFSIGLFHILL